jgi:hypothetical protein
MDKRDVALRQAVVEIILELFDLELKRVKSLDDGMYKNEAYLRGLQEGRIEGLESAIKIVNGWEEVLSRSEKPECKDAAALATEALNG